MKRAEEVRLARLKKAKEAKARAKALEQAQRDDIEARQKEVIAQLEAIAAIKQKEPKDLEPKLDKLNESILALTEKLLSGITIKNIADGKSAPSKVITEKLELPEWLKSAPSHKDIVKAIEQNTTVLGALEKAQKSQLPEDFIPVRRVYKAGNRFLFDDSSTGSYSGGGGGSSSSSGSVAITNTNYAVRWDDTTTDNVVYVGKADIATATSAPLWQIKKIDQTTGGVITWADGNDEFDNIWDNRAALTYS